MAGNAVSDVEEVNRGYRKTLVANATYELENKVIKLK